MKAVQFNELGNLEALYLQEIPLANPKENEVRIKLTSIGLNRADLLFCQGRYFVQPTLPSRVGLEGAGIVDEIGKNVTQWKVGDRVGVIPATFSVSEQGCVAEYGIYEENWLVPTPDQLSDQLAGSIWTQYLTVWGALVYDANINQRSTVVISAASSATGIAAMQVAKAKGATVIATSTSANKFETLRSLGADYVLNTQEDNYVQRVKEISGGKGADVIFDAVAGLAMKKQIASTAPGAIIYVYGLLDRRPMDIHAGVMMKKLLTIKGYTFSALLADENQWRTCVAEITEAIQSEKLSPVIAKVFPLAEYQQAFRFLESNQQIGKILITPIS